MSFSVILPTLNENGHIIKLIEEISQILITQKIQYEIIVVDDNSDDGTYETVKKFQQSATYLKVLSRKDKNRNLANSLNDGIFIAKFEHLIWLDADFQHPPKYISEFINKSKKFDVIICSRFLEESDRYFKNSKLEKEINENQSYIFNKICQKMLFKDITDYTSGFICIKRKFFNNFKLKGFYGDYFVDMIIELKKKKIRILEIPFKDEVRASGSSKTVVTVNAKYLYTCFRYFITLIKSIIRSKINY